MLDFALEHLKDLRIKHKGFRREKENDKKNPIIPFIERKFTSTCAKLFANSYVQVQRTNFVLLFEYNF